MARRAVTEYSIVALSAEKLEGDSGTTAFTFTVTRTSGKGKGKIDYAVTGAQADDFDGGQRPAGTVTFAKGETEKTITILVAGDSVSELDETFAVTLSNAHRGVIDPARASASGTILDDENAHPTGIDDTGTGLSVDENTAAGYQVADLDATDLDGDPISYYFKAENGDHVQSDGNFDIDATTGVVTTARVFDFEDDGGNLSFTAFAGAGDAEDSGTYAVPIRNVAETQVIDFAGTVMNTDIPDGYKGFNWDSVRSVFASPNEQVWNLGADRASFETSDGTNFNLVSLKLFSESVTLVRLTAYEDGLAKYPSVDVDLSGSGFSDQVTATLDWTGIDKITIDVITSSGDNVWYMDDIVIGEYVGVDFEGTAVAPLPDGYAGLTWESSNSIFSDTVPEVAGGHPTNLNGPLFDIAPDNELAWNGAVGKNTIISGFDDLDLVSMDLINGQQAGNGANELHITAYDAAGALIDEIDITLTTSLTTHVLNWNDVDKIHIDVIGGTWQYQTDAVSGFWGMDNLILA